MKLRELLPRAAGMRELVNWGDDHLYFESEVLILPDSTFFGWRMFVEEDASQQITAESSLCKNTDEWGWQDEKTSHVSDEVREILEAELMRFKKVLAECLGEDIQEWENQATASFRRAFPSAAAPLPRA